MSEHKHTPGPWAVNKATPCTVLTPDGRISVSWSSTDGICDAKGESAAQLIAAAPDLLAALEESKIVFHLAIDLANSTSEIDTDQMKKRMKEIVVRRNAAIAKATGGAA